MTNIDPGAPNYEYDWQNPDKKTFDFGRVFSRAIDIIKLRGMKMLVISTLLLGLPILLISLWPMFIGTGVQDFADVTDPSAILDVFTGGVLAAIVIGLLFLIIASLWVQPALIKIAYSALTDEDSPNLSILKHVSKFVLPILGFYILYFVACMIGFVLLIIPAIFIAFGWMLAAQIIVLEEQSVTDSISKAWTLSKGSKRWLLLLAIVFGIIGSVISVIISIPIYVMGDPNLAMLEGASSFYWILNGLLSAIGQMIATIIGVAWTTSAYVELRKIREGVDPESQVDVFN